MRVSSGGLHNPNIYGQRKSIFENTIRYYQESPIKNRSTSTFVITEIYNKPTMSPKISNVALAETIYQFSQKNLANYQFNKSKQLSKPKLSLK